ncbi:MAG: MarR family transcriptional regulator [Thermoplasmata archaeon]|nr:MarR family transcriptional regulator [Candidatus Thermoplasmatota archaeon]MCK4457572.1 MarR family transcriptional regulator [Thermoplasmata archaeon]
MSGTTGRVFALEGMPPSAKLVYRVLLYNGPMTHKELREETGLGPRTLRFALSKLKNSDVVVERIRLEDARQKVVHIRRLGELL